MADVVYLDCLGMGLTEQLDPARQVATVVVDDRSRNTGLGHGGLQLTVDHLLVRHRHRLQFDRFHLCQAERVFLARRGQLRNSTPKMTRHFSLPI